MNRTPTMKLNPIALALLLVSPPIAHSAAPPPDRSGSAASFAPLPADHELAAFWNDPDFKKRLIGSYGFASDVEPKLQPEEVATWREKIVPLLQSEDYDKAIPMLVKLTQQKNPNALFDFTLGNIHFERSNQTNAQVNLTNAIHHFRAALQIFPDFRRAHQNLGFALVRAERFGEAIEPLTRTIALGGANGDVFGALGFSFMKQNRFVSAEAAYRQALVFKPDSVDLGRALVQCAVETRNYEYALALLDEMIQRDPEQASLWSLQANIYRQTSDMAKAAVSMEMLRRLDQAKSEDLYLLGDLYMVQEAPELALGAYQEAIDKDEGQDMTRALRPAEILVSRGAWKEAQTLFGKIRESGATLGAEDQLKMTKLESKVLMDSGQGEKGIDMLEQVIQRDGTDGEALLLAGDYYARNEQPEKAEFRYLTAAKIEGFEADAKVRHAQMLVQSRDYRKAVDLLREAQRVKPRDNVQRFLEQVEKLALDQQGT